jgi:hypothetical protein
MTLEVHYHVHKSLAGDPNLNRLNPVHTLTSHLFMTYLNIIFPRTNKRSILWGFLTKISYVFIICFTQLILLDLIILKYLVKSKKLCNLLCKLPHSPVTYLRVRDKISHPHKPICKIMVLYTLIFAHFQIGNSDREEQYHAFAKFNLLFMLSQICFIWCCHFQVRELSQILKGYIIWIYINLIIMPSCKYSSPMTLYYKSSHNSSNRQAMPIPPPCLLVQCK